MPIRSPRTTRNYTRYPVEVGATEAILAGLPDTDSLIELPDVTTYERWEATTFILDIMQDMHMALEQDPGGLYSCPEECFYWEHSTLEDTYSRALDLVDDERLLTIAAQLPATAWQGTLWEEDAVLVANAPAGEYLVTVTRQVLLAIRHLMWEAAAELIGDGILSWNGRHLVWNEDEVPVPWYGRTGREGNR